MSRKSFAAVGSTFIIIAALGLSLLSSRTRYFILNYQKLHSFFEQVFA